MKILLKDVGNRCRRQDENENELRTQKPGARSQNLEARRQEQPTGQQKPTTTHTL